MFNTQTNEIVKILDKVETTTGISSATVAMSIDPLCEKYYWISPYVYCANNPLKFIDPDGRQIVFKVGDKEYTYNGQNVTTASGQKGDFPAGSNFAGVVQGYNDIRNSGDPVLASKVQHLMNSENVHYIVDNNGQSANSVAPGSKKTAMSEDKANIEAGKGIGTTTRFKLSDSGKASFKKAEGVSISNSEIVAHEMQHQFDYDQGNMKDSQGKKGASSPAEGRAVNTENRMRKINGSEKRTTYGGKPLDTKK